jgi:Tfp pilus assembly protein PilO
MRLDLWKKEGILPLALGLFVLAAASYFLLFLPELRTIRILKADIASKEAEVAEALKLRASVAESRTGDKGRWERQLRSWEERVPSSPESERLLAEIGEQAVRHNLKSFGLTVVADSLVQGATPQEAGVEGTGTDGKGRMLETRYRITFRSTYRDLAEFLDEILRMRRLLTVRSVSIKEASGAMASAIEISAWYRGRP